MTNTESRSRGRWQLVVLALMFFGPAVIAWAMVLSGWRPEATTNNGVLLDPPVRQGAEGWRRVDGGGLDAGMFAGRWTWLVPMTGDCSQRCKELLEALQRVRIALDKDRDRVRILVVQPPGAEPPPAPPSPGRAVVRARAPAGRVSDLLTTAPDGGVAGMAVFIVDYLGFRMMAYPLPLEGSDLLDDMERVLKLAKEEVEAYRQRQRGSAAN